MRLMPTWSACCKEPLLSDKRYGSHLQRRTRDAGRTSKGAHIILHNTRW